MALQESQNRNPGGASVYPLHPSGTKVLLRVPGSELTVMDRAAVALTSLGIIGAFAWTPAAIAWFVKKYRAIPKTEKRKRAVYAGVAAVVAYLVVYGPHRNRTFARYLRIEKWNLWTSWMRYLALEVASDNPQFKQNEPAVLAIFSHGIFPFSLALTCVGEQVQKAFGIVRPVTATATKFLPIVGDFIAWVNNVDASQPAVERALANKDRIAIVPGGISEMFEGYPKPGTHPDEEYSIVRRGFIRLAQKHNTPIIPVYCFGSTKLFRRLQLPLLEKISSYLRASVVVFYGLFGLPIPFRQKLLYVIGNTISPYQSSNEMHQQLCEELQRLFEDHKDSYGWSHKTLKLITK